MSDISGTVESFLPTLKLLETRLHALDLAPNEAFPARHSFP